MADIIDAFVVSLGIDAREYKEEIKKYREDRKKLAEENESYGQREEDTQKRSTDGIRKLRNETAGFLVMLAGANRVQQFAGNLLSTDAATGRLARNLGMATERVAVWEEAVKRAGGQAGDATAALSTLFGIFQNFQLYGDNSKSGALAFFGLSEQDLRDPEAALLRIAEVVKKMPRADVEARLATLGIGGPIANLLAGDRGDLPTLLAQIEKIGVATDESAKAAQDFEAEMARLTQTIKAAARPAVAGLADELVRFSGEVEGIVQSLSSAYNRLPSGLIGFFDNIGAMLSGGDYKNIWDYIGEATEEYGGGVIKERYGAQGKGGASGGSSGTGMGWLPYGAGRGASVGGGRPKGKLTRAERNNNPGNIEDGAFARRQPGYAGGDGRFAKFTSAEAGFAAMERLLMGRGYMGGGRNTIASIIAKYAPSSDNNDVNAYAASIERATGIGRHTALSASQLRPVTRAMARHEGYRGGSVNVPSSAGMRRPASAAGGRSVSQTNSTTVGQINVYTQATNATDITQSLRDAMAKRGLVVQAGAGLRP